MRIGRRACALITLGLLAGCVTRAPSPAPARPAPEAPTPWADWRGPRRDGVVPSLPDSLPKAPRILWKRPLTGLGLSGIAATRRHVIVADKANGERDDVWRCLDADTGSPLWTLTYPAPAEMDHGNCPRAFPVIHGGLVYLLGAFGHLHCVRLETGEAVWQRHIIRDFGARLVTWGLSASPLAVDGKLIVNPGAKDASLVALDRRTGKTVWKSPGRPSAYASFIVATLGGVRQIVGYDATTLGGWDPATGRRLWELRPPEEGDYNVPTPIAIDGKLLVTTENNDTRLYGFDARGRIEPKPLAVNPDLGPDSSTPVVVGGLVFGCSSGLICLDARDGLKTVWKVEEPRVYDDYCSLIGAPGRVLITTARGELILIRAARRYEVLGRLRWAPDAEVFAHPAPLGRRLYLRDQRAISCLLLDE